VVVIGACTPAHDIMADYYERGIGVMMFQRSSIYIMSYKNGLSVALAGLYSEYVPPADIPDRLLASYPHYMSVGMGQRTTRTRQGSPRRFAFSRVPVERWHPWDRFRVLGVEGLLFRHRDRSAHRGREYQAKKRTTDRAFHG